MPPPTAAQTSDEALAALTAPPILRVAGGASMIAGGFTFALALQTAVFVIHRAPFLLLAAVLFALGLTVVASGWRTMKGHGRAAVVATSSCGSLAVISLVWLVYAFLHGFVTPLSFGVSGMSCLAALLSGVAVGPAKRIDAARTQLRSQGFDIGT